MEEMEVIIDGVKGWRKWVEGDGILVGDFVIGLEGLEEGLQILGSMGLDCKSSPAQTTSDR